MPKKESMVLKKHEELTNRKMKKKVILSPLCENSWVIIYTFLKMLEKIWVLCCDAYGLYKVMKGVFCQQNQYWKKVQNGRHWETF